MTPSWGASLPRGCFRDALPVLPCPDHGRASCRPRAGREAGIWKTVHEPRARRFLRLPRLWSSQESMSSEGPGHPRA